MLTHPDIALAIAREHSHMLLHEATNDLLVAQLPQSSERSSRWQGWNLLAFLGTPKPRLDPAAIR